LSFLRGKTVEMLERKTQDTHTNESKSFQANIQLFDFEGYLQ
jgi:hypothetical protein